MTKYTDDEVERALQELVLADENVTKACERLAQVGRDVPTRTMREWRSTHAVLFDRLKSTREDWTAEAMAEQAERAARLAGEGEERMAAAILERTADELAKLSPQVIAGAMQKLSVAKAINVDKANVLRGRPSKITEDRTLAELGRLLTQRFPGVVQINPAVLGEAKELPSGPDPDDKP